MTFVALNLVLGPVTSVSVLLDPLPVSFLGLPKCAHFQSAISSHLMAGRSSIEVHIGGIVLTKLLFDRDALRSSLVECTSLGRRVKCQVANIITCTGSSVFDLGSGYMRIILKDSVRKGWRTS